MVNLGVYIQLYNQPENVYTQEIEMDPTNWPSADINI